MYTHGHLDASIIVVHCDHDDQKTFPCRCVIFSASLPSNCARELMQLFKSLIKITALMTMMTTMVMIQDLSALQGAANTKATCSQWPIFSSGRSGVLIGRSALAVVTRGLRSVIVTVIWPKSMDVICDPLSISFPVILLPQ